MLIPNRFTNTEKPTHQPHLEVESLDVRSVPALLNADAMVYATLAANAIAAAGADHVAASQEQALQSAATERAALAASIDAVATIFPAADAALAAARPAAPDALRGIASPAIASALQAGRLELSSEMMIPGTAAAAPGNPALAGPTLFPPPVPPPALPDTASTIPTALETSAPTTAAVPPALELPEMRGPFPADPFQALGTAPPPLPGPLPELDSGFPLGAAPGRQTAVAEARPANIVVTWQPPAVVADAVPIVEAPTAQNVPLIDEESTPKSAWPLAPALAALYEVWYRGNRN